MGGEGGCGLEADSTIATLTQPLSVSPRSGLFATMLGIPPYTVLFAGSQELVPTPDQARAPQSSRLHRELSDATVASVSSAIILGPKNEGPVTCHGPD